MGTENAMMAGMGRVGWLTEWWHKRRGERAVVDILGAELLAEAKALASGRTVGVCNAGGARSHALTEEIATWFRTAGFLVPSPPQGEGGTATGIHIGITSSGETCRGLAEAIQTRLTDGGIDCRISKFPPVPNESIVFVIFVAPREFSW